MTDKLKPCPFCGFDDLQPEFKGEGFPYKHLEDWRVDCDHCGASPISDSLTFEKAVTAWNTRTFTQENVERAVDALQAASDQYDSPCDRGDAEGLTKAALEAVGVIKK